MNTERFATGNVAPAAVTQTETAGLAEICDRVLICDGMATPRPPCGNGECQPSRTADIDRERDVRAVWRQLHKSLDVTHRDGPIEIGRPGDVGLNAEHPLHLK